MIHSNIANGKFFIDKQPVLSPAVRPVVVGEDLRDSMVDEMNEIYQRVITLSNQIKTVSGTMFDVLSYKMQLVIREMYEYIKVKVAKKQGIIRNLMLGKRVDFSARAVISPNPNLKVGEVGIPLYMACNIFEPHLIFGLVNSPQAKRLPDEFHAALKEFLGKELDPDILL